MSGSWFKAAMEGASKASGYVNATCTQVKATAELVSKMAGYEQSQPKKPAEEKHKVKAQSVGPDPTGKISMNFVNRCASMLEEDDAGEWDDAYLRPDIVNYDKIIVQTYGILVENGEWVYLLDQDRQ